jgi:3-keto-5-aminohexanoate cleavage enzyme
LSAAGGRRVVIAVAPNGGRKSKADHPGLPVTPKELARTAADCLERGAAMLHLHVRDAEGAHVLDPDIYRAALAEIAEAVGDRLVVQITSESLGRYSPAEQQAAVLATNPEAVTVALREFAPDRSHDRAFCEFLGELKRMHIWPQIILYSLDDAQRLAALHKQGLIPFEGLSVLYVLGRFALLRTASPADLLPFVAPEAPRFASWSVCAFGRREAACVAAGALLGGHIRVGFENNLLLPDGERAAANADLVALSARALSLLGLTRENADGLRAEIAAMMD